MGIYRIKNNLHMKIKLFYTFLGILALTIILYFFIFIKSEIIEDSHLLTFCKKNNYIEINLLDSFHYIDEYKIKESKDTINVCIYITTIGNFMDKKKMTHFNIYDNNKIIVIKNKILKPEDIITCN